MHILITGGMGFIGSNLRDFLIEKGHKITCVDNLSSGSNIGKGILIKADVVTFDFDSLPDDIAQIYHLACPASPKMYQRDPIHTAKTNFIGTMNVLEFAKKRGIRVLLTSTSEVYGDPLEHPQKETYWGNVNPIGIRSCYDEGKRIAETLMFDYHRVYGVDIRVVRIFNTYGPNMDKDDGRVVSNFVCQTLQNKDITIYGTGSQTRSCCYVSDNVQGLYSFMNQTEMIGPANLGNPEEVTVKELAELVLRLIPESRSKAIYENLPQDDPKVRRPDISKISKFWQPKVGLEEGIKMTIEYFRSALSK
jgi:UDP-glucuronate decarboxylase